MKNLLIDGLSGSGKWVIARMCCSIEGAISLGMDEQFEILLNSNYILLVYEFLMQYFL